MRLVGRGGVATPEMMACYWGRYLVVEEARGWTESSQVLHECGGRGVRRHDRDQNQDQDDVRIAEE